MKVELPYLREDSYANVSESPFGYRIIERMERYRGLKIRNRVIVRLDILTGMTEFFEKQTLVKNRDIISALMLGYLEDDKTVSEILNILYQGDETFKRYLGETYYFNKDSKTTSLYAILVLQFKEIYNKKVNNLRSRLMDLDAKYVEESNGYVYLASRDDIGPIYVPKEYSQEALTYGKDWNGDFKGI